MIVRNVVHLLFPCRTKGTFGTIINIFVIKYTYSICIGTDIVNFIGCTTYYYAKARTIVFSPTRVAPFYLVRERYYNSQGSVKECHKNSARTTRFKNAKIFAKCNRLSPNNTNIAR